MCDLPERRRLCGCRVPVDRAFSLTGAQYKTCCETPARSAFGQNYSLLNPKLLGGGCDTTFGRTSEWGFLNRMNLPLYGHSPKSLKKESTKYTKLNIISAIHPSNYKLRK